MTDKSSVDPCAFCRELGYWLNPEGAVVPCPSAECQQRAVREAAVELLGVEGGRSEEKTIFKGGAFQVTMAIRGFEMAPNTLAKIMEGNREFRRLVSRTPDGQGSESESG